MIVDDEGVITSPPAPLLGERGDVEKYDGIIVPGFVNTHCHLELSHLKGLIPEGKGLVNFISELVPKRDKFSPEVIKSAIIAAEEEMFRNGIVAVGDISNTDHSFEQKKKERLTYHTFIEAFDLDPSKAQHVFDEALKLQKSTSGIETSVAPHATYTVSGKLMELIDNLKQSILSIHNQETASENELFNSGTGPLAEMLERAGVDMDSKRKAKNPLLFILGALIEARKLLLVHNTFTSKADLELMKHYMLGSELEVILCLCPRANLYIENRLPDTPMFLEAGMKITLGTDSLASNRSLSILEEMKIISKQFPQIPFEALLAWATQNGAEALGFEKELGTIEKGKKPGLNLIKGIDLAKMQLTEATEVERLV